MAKNAPYLSQMKRYAGHATSRRIILRRAVDRVLEAWAEDDRRRPLLIRGARQVGKTYAVTALGERTFADVASINLERQPRYGRCFDTLEPRAILDQIGVLRGKPVEPGRTLLFIDEIQECPAAVMALRYFYEQMPELHVIGAGSLLEFALEAERLPMPVGRIQPLFMHPLSFAEFLPAVGEEPALQASRTLAAGAGTAVHEHLIALLRTYLLLGGMPAVVAEYLETGSVAQATRIQTAITQTFRDDFGKYARASRHHLLDRVFLHAARWPGASSCIRRSTRTAGRAICARRWSCWSGPAWCAACARPRQPVCRWARKRMTVTTSSSWSTSVSCRT